TITIFLSIISPRLHRWRLSCIIPATCYSGERLGCHLTTLFSSTAIPVVAPAAPKKKYGMLPLLTILFLLSYGLMTMLIVIQGSTIETQRALIRDLFNDSVELSSYKGRALAEKKMAAQHKAQTQAPVAKSPATQSPSVQTPSTQTQQNQTPSSQVAP